MALIFYLPPYTFLHAFLPNLLTFTFFNNDFFSFPNITFIPSEYLLLFYFYSFLDYFEDNIGSYAFGLLPRSPPPRLLIVSFPVF